LEFLIVKLRVAAGVARSFPHELFQSHAGGIFILNSIKRNIFSKKILFKIFNQ
jgi:hypothetical protein